MPEKIVLITDVPQDHPELTDESVAMMVDLDRFVMMMSLCSSPWSRRPGTLVELIYNTFKPIFCVGETEELPSARFRAWVDWYTWDGANFRELTGNQEWPPRCLFERTDGCLMIIASTKATNALLGVSLKGWYEAHLKAINDKGERHGITIDMIDMPFGSPLASIPADVAKKIEVVVLPPPGKNPMVSSLYEEDGDLSILRCDYIRRAHQALGCDRHAIW